MLTHVPRREQGVALITTLMILLLLLTVGMLLMTRMVMQLRAVGDSIGSTRANLAARSALSIGTAALYADMRDNLSQVVIQTSANNSRWSYGSSAATDLRPIASTVQNDLAGVATRMQAYADATTCAAPIQLGTQSATIRIYFTATACGAALPSGLVLPPARYVDGAPRIVGGAALQTYALPFVLVAQATDKDRMRVATMLGQYQFQVGRSSFARYGLFTNYHTTAAGQRVVFTSNTLFDGPVHTNDRFTFFNGAPWFGSYVTSAGCTNTACTARSPGMFLSVSGGTYAQSANAANTGLSSGSYCRTYSICPEFTRGIDMNASVIPMPNNATNQLAAAQSGGLDFSTQDINLTAFVGNAGGNAGTGPAFTYQYFVKCTTAGTACTTYRAYDTPSGPMIQARIGTPPGGSGYGVAVPFNGMIYARSIYRLAGPDRTTASNPASAPPAIARWAQINISATNDVRVTRDLRYEDPPCTGDLARVSGAIQRPDCSNLAAENILGIYSQNGGISIGSSLNGSGTAVVNPLDHAPNDVTIQGVLMAATDEINVEQYNIGPSRGSVRLLGGIIENYYGAFGTTGSSTGFGRSFVYDPRLLNGMSPPTFPTTSTDEVKAIFVRGYATKEQ